MQYFNFDRLIQKYKSSLALEIVTEGGYDDNGDYVKTSSSQLTVEGAVLSLKDSKIYRSNGTLTAKDKVLYMLEPISNSLEGSTVIYENNVYRIEDCEENFKFTGVCAYTLKYVSAFKEQTADDITEEAEKLDKRLDGVLND